jgi:hypothetical protein
MTDFITLTRDAYDMLHNQAALNERAAILQWLRSAKQPMTHSCWQLAREIEAGAHHG